LDPDGYFDAVVYAFGFADRVAYTFVYGYTDLVTLPNLFHDPFRDANGVAYMDRDPLLDAH